MNLNSVSWSRLFATFTFLSALNLYSSAYAQVDANEVAKANALFASADAAHLELHPISASWRGLKQGNDRWNDLSDAGFAKDIALAEQSLARAKQINPALLDDFTRVSLQMFRQSALDSIEDARWRDHGYLINQMWGEHTMVPALLINQHTIDDEKDARAFIARLEKVSVYFDQVIARLQTQQAKGIMAPKFVLEKSLEQTLAVINARPFTSNAKNNSPVLDAFSKKVLKLKLPAARKNELIKTARATMLSHFGPAYQRLAAAIKTQIASATTDDGVWKLPDGAKYYATMLKRHTTTDFDAEQLHALGLKEVERLQKEMTAVARADKFTGDQSALFASLSSGKDNYYDNTNTGRNDYMRHANEAIAAINQRLPELFGRLPKAAFEIKRVEPFREKGAASAFYENPSADGKRPGRYFINLYDMKALPKSELQALAYHEAIPGHHMQLAIAQELPTMPEFRKYGFYTAYGEGWALYAEQVPIELGLYTSTSSRLGQLSMALWRAARLVVDTGIHSKRWTRDQTIAYLKANTPVSDADAVTETERYIVDAGQATAYHVGMMKIIALREKAKLQLGTQFDIRLFHDTVLGSGSVPLNVLEGEIDAMIARVKAQSAR